MLKSGNWSAVEGIEIAYVEHLRLSEKIKTFNRDEITDASVEVAFADGTKTHSQEKGKSKNRVNVVLGVNNGKKVLLDARVNKPWEETASKLDEAAALEDRKGLIRRLETLLFSLKNSVEKHRKDGDLDALKGRINSTVDGLKKSYN